MGKRRSSGQKKDNSSKSAHIEANRQKRKLKYLTEREKRKGTTSSQSKEVNCGCGTTVRIRKYIVKNSYKCASCRGLTNDKSKSLVEQPGQDDRKIDRAKASRRRFDRRNR